MKLTKLLVPVLLGTILLSSAVPAASIGTTMLGTVNGYVKTQNGDAVPSCTVELRDSTGTKGTVITDSNGYYTIKIATGSYQLRALKSDVGISPMSNITIPATPAITRDLTIPSIPRTVLLSASKDSVTADKASYTFAWGEQTDAEVTAITATVKDVFGHPTGNEYHLNFSIDASPYDGNIDGRLGGGNMWYAGWRWSLVAGTTINNPTTFLYGLVSNKTKYTAIKVRVTAKDDTTTYASNTISINIVKPQNHTITYTPSPISQAPVKAAFAISPASGTAPLTVRFSDLSTGSPTSWSWNFGDSATSTQTSPTHTYTQPGTYYPELVVESSASHTTSTMGGVPVIVNAPAGQSNTGNMGVTITPTPPTEVQAGTPSPEVQNNGSSDTNPPVTIATLAGTPGNVTDVYTSDVQVILLANDGNGAGLQLTRYSLDGASWSIYTAPFTVSKDGVNTVYYYSVDNANNTEATHVKPFTIAHQAQAQSRLPCLNLLVLPLLIVGVLAVARRKKGGQ